MFYRVLRDCAGHKAGEVLDIGDPELAEMLKRQMGDALVQIDEAEAHSVPASSVKAAAPKIQPVTRSALVVRPAEVVIKPDHKTEASKPPRH